MEEESQQAINLSEPIRPREHQSKRELNARGGFVQAQLYFKYQAINFHTQFGKFLFSEIWKQISTYLVNFRYIVDLCIFILSIGSLFAIIPIFYNYTYHNFSALTGYRFGAAASSLGAVNDSDIKRQLILNTIPDIVYSFLIGVLVLFFKYYYFLKSSCHTQMGILRKKTTPAVRILGYSEKDCQILNVKEISQEFEYNGNLKAVFDRVTQIEHLMEVKQKEGQQDQQLDRKIEAKARELEELEVSSAERTDSMLVIFQTENDRCNFVELMKINGRTNKAVDRLFGRFREDKRIYEDSKVRLQDQYVDQPEDIFLENLDSSKIIKAVRTIVFVLLFLLLLFANFAVVSLPMALGVKNPAVCSYPSKQTLDTVAGASDADKYCFCANNEFQFFTINYNNSFKETCNSSIDYVLMSQSMLVLSSVANVGINVLTSYLVPFLASSLLVFGSAYSRQSAFFFLSLAAQLCNLIVLPLLINARFYNFRPINTINFMLHSVRPTNTGYNDFTRLWFANMSVWFVTNLLLMLAVPWIRLLVTVLNLRLRRSRLQAKGPLCTRLQIQEFASHVQYSLAEMLADLLAPIFFTLFFCSGMPVLLPICLLNAVMHFFAIHLRVYYVQVRGYLPPAMFYSRIATTFLYFVLIHILIGCYMYGNILDCSQIYKNPSGVFDRGGKIIAPIHVFIFAMVFIGCGLVFQLLTECLICDSDSQNYQATPETTYSVDKSKKYRNAVKYLTLPPPNLVTPVKYKRRDAQSDYPVQSQQKQFTQI